MLSNVSLSNKLLKYTLIQLNWCSLNILFLDNIELIDVMFDCKSLHWHLLYSYWLPTGCSCVCLYVFTKLLYINDTCVVSQDTICLCGREEGIFEGGFSFLFAKILCFLRYYSAIFKSCSFVKDCMGHFLISNAILIKVTRVVKTVHLRYLLWRYEWRLAWVLGLLLLVTVNVLSCWINLCLCF